MHTPIRSILNPQISQSLSKAASHYSESILQVLSKLHRIRAGGIAFYAIDLKAIGIYGEYRWKARSIWIVLVNVVLLPQFSHLDLQVRRLW